MLVFHFISSYEMTHNVRSTLWFTSNLVLVMQKAMLYYVTGRSSLSILHMLCDCCVPSNNFDDLSHSCKFRNISMFLKLFQDITLYNINNTCNDLDTSGINRSIIDITYGKPSISWQWNYFKLSCPILPIVFQHLLEKCYRKQSITSSHSW